MLAQSAVMTLHVFRREIALKGLNIEEKLLWRAYSKSPMLFQTVPSPTPYSLPFPRLGVRNPNPKLQSLLSQEGLQLRSANLADTFTGSSEHKPKKKLGEMGARAYPGTVEIFSVPPIISGTGKATKF